MDGIWELNHFGLKLTLTLRRWIFVEILRIFLRRVVNHVRSKAISFILIMQLIAVTLEFLH